MSLSTDDPASHIHALGSARVREGMQVTLISLGWILVLGMWVKVIARAEGHTVAVTGITLAVGLGVILLSTISWVAHNRRIYLRKGPRNNTRSVVEDFERDFLARPIVANWSDVKASSLVRVVVVDGKKRFDIFDPPTRPRHRGMQ